MKRPLGTLGAFAAGALAMYYLDPQHGQRRRAQLGELLHGGFSSQREPGGGRPSRRIYTRVTQADPQSDAQLRDQIQERLGRLVSHPGAIDVSVSNGVVRLSGRVLAKEREGLLLQVQDMDGVQKLVNAMTAHDDPQEIARTPAAAEPAARGAG